MTKIVGFTSGAFDMFHVGHLNLIKNAKERCDYLIVGVNSDELIASYKSKKTIVPLNERIEIIKSIRYVDEVMRIDSLDKRMSWAEKQYSIIFIGDDWKGNQRWHDTEKVMSAYGVEVIYLPYTENTSSSLLREKLTSY
jgi:glycerol-3-phosphate cytidylyltransferase